MLCQSSLILRLETAALQAEVIQRTPKADSPSRWTLINLSVNVLMSSAFATRPELYAAFLGAR
jgi:hypothetical protein